MRLLPLLAVTLVLASCAAVPKPQPAAPRPVPSYTPPPPPPRPLSSDWRDWPYTPGDWRYRQEARGSIAAFGAGGAPVFTIRCDLAAGAVTLSRPGTAAGPATMTIRTSTLLRALPLQDSADTLTATLAPRDPLLEAMGFSRGRFIIEQTGAPRLVLPSWAEIGRVTEDCRR
ncbi:hypothetical protein ACFOKI_13225 [Sphingomonas qilianensis]|uniref:Lipoprotein n=1 Tax=Sphingomonas qilianensis TaxID=1736690 RepID=A0ABU9XN98_9SPHN